MAIDRARPDEPVDVEELLGELEHKIERLKILYEQYFMGIEKLEPQTARKEVARKLLELTQLNIRNTGIRYRFNALNQRWGVYQTYWNRTLRAIASGTYTRNVIKAGKEAVRRGVEMPEEVLRALPARLRERLVKDREALRIRDEREAVRRGATRPEAKTAEPARDEEFEAAFGNLVPAEPPRPPPKPAPPRGGIELPPGMDEAAARQLYERYLSAKRVVGEDVSKLRFEAVVTSLARQAPKIMADHKAKGVEFSVVIKDQKVVLKATPKK